MARPEYLICLECESEVEDFTWREGEVRRAACEVCGNADPDAFALPDDFDQETTEDEEPGEAEDEEDEIVEDYADFEEEEEEE